MSPIANLNQSCLAGYVDCTLNRRTGHAHSAQNSHTRNLEDEHVELPREDPTSYDGSKRLP